jgi:hypothetical protein
MNWIGFGRKPRLSNRNLSGETGENKEKLRQNNLCPGQDSNRALPG